MLSAQSYCIKCESALFSQPSPCPKCDAYDAAVMKVINGRASKTAESPDSGAAPTTNTLSTEIALELDGIAMVLERHPDLGGSREIERLNAVIARLRT